MELTAPVAPIEESVAPVIEEPLTDENYKVGYLVALGILMVLLPVFIQPLQAAIDYLRQLFY